MEIASWALIDRIDKIINNNVKEVQWEGTEVDRSGLKEDILILIRELTEKKKKEDLSDYSRNQKFDEWMRLFYGD